MLKCEELRFLVRDGQESYIYIPSSLDADYDQQLQMLTEIDSDGSLEDLRLSELSLLGKSNCFEVRQLLRQI